MKIKLKYRIAIQFLNLISKTWIFKTNIHFDQSKGIIAFWHGNMLPVWKYFAKYQPYAIVSMSKDGEILTQILQKWGYTVIRGSSSKGSKDALNNIITIAANNLVLITPDGPRGPINKFKPGAVIAAQRSGSKLTLCKTIIKNKIIFKKSWDKFQLPLFFSKIYLNFSESENISEDLNRDEIKRVIDRCEFVLNEQ